MGPQGKPLNLYVDCIFYHFYHRLFLSLGKISILKKFGVPSNNLEFKSSYNFQDNVINSLLSYELPSL